MKLNVHRTVNPDAARRWPRLNAGSRRQIEVPMAGVRHFRAGATAVKRAGQAAPAATDMENLPGLVAGARWDEPQRIITPILPSRPLLRGDRAYLRALRAAEMKAWQASGGDVFRPQFAE